MARDTDETVQEDGMDKLGVQTAGMSDEELEKKSSYGCPQCGRPAQRHGQVVVCPAHGSEPFER